MAIISEIFSYFSNSYVYKLLNISYFGNTIENYILGLLIIFLFYIIGIFVKKILCGKLSELAAKTETKTDDIIIEALKKYVVLIFLNTGLYFSLNYLVFSKTLDSIINFILLSFYIILGTWFLIKFIEFLIEVYLVPLSEKSDPTVDQNLPPILKNFSKIIIFVIAGLIFFSKLGFDVKNLWAGLGIGGLAIAFAAQDLLANLFGGLSIMFDKPFKIGQRIRINGVDGTITQMRIRTTRIKTLDGTMVVMPNRKFSENHIENLTKAVDRKVSFEIQIAYNTTNEKINKAIEIIKNIITSEKEIKETITVYFGDFGQSSLNIPVIYWITNGMNDWPKTVEIKNRINLRIKEEFENEGIEFAYPRQTIYLKKD